MGKGDPKRRARRLNRQGRPRREGVERQPSGQVKTSCKEGYRVGPTDEVRTARIIAFGADRSQGDRDDPLDILAARQIITAEQQQAGKLYRRDVQRVCTEIQAPRVAMGGGMDRIDGSLALALHETDTRPSLETARRALWNAGRHEYRVTDMLCTSTMGDLALLAPDQLLRKLRVYGADRLRHGLDALAKVYGINA